MGLTNSYYEYMFIDTPAGYLCAGNPILGGSAMSIREQLKDAFQRYLDRLSKENQALFGSGRPDCCTLNKKKGPQPPTKKDGDS